jgi:hypothetical protein
MNYIDTKAKCRHLKKFTFKGALRLMFYLSEAQKPIPPPPLTHCIRVKQYTWYLFTQGREGGGSNQREATVHKTGRKYQHD